MLIASDPLSLNLTLRLETGKGLDRYITTPEQRCTVTKADGTVILRQMASALSHLHAQQLVHDDVKLDNIVWDAVAKRAVLIDFGAALNFAVLPADYFNPSGTPSYAPPEFLDRRKGPEGDVWALGVVMLFVWGYLRLPDGEWLLPGVWDAGGGVEMRAWLSEVKGLRGQVGKEVPVLVEMLNEDPDERIGSVELVRKLATVNEL